MSEWNNISLCREQLQWSFFYREGRPQIPKRRQKNRWAINSGRIMFDDPINIFLIRRSEISTRKVKRNFINFA